MQDILQIYDTLPDTVRLIMYFDALYCIIPTFLFLLCIQDNTNFYMY